MNNRADIYVMASIFFMIIARQYFKQALKWGSLGYVFICGASLLLSIAYILWKYEAFLFPTFAVFAFLSYESGICILATTEKHIKQANKRVPFYKRILRIITNEKVKDSVTSSAGEHPDGKKEDNLMYIAVGVFAIVSGILIAVWEKELIFSVTMAVLGIHFILLVNNKRNRSNL